MYTARTIGINPALQSWVTLEGSNMLSVTVTEKQRMPDQHTSLFQHPTYLTLSFLTQLKIGLVSKYMSKDALSISASNFLL